MIPRKAILIFNPKTGRYGSRRAPRLAPLCDYLKSKGVEVEQVSTTGPGDATRIAARAALNNIGEVIVSGGDGTINEALQGLIGSNTRLSILPHGTGNVLAHELKLPINSRQAAAVIARGHTRKVHLGCAIDEASQSRRYFFLMAGVGLDASVVSRVNPKLKKRIGKAAFWYSGFSHLADWKPTPFKIEINSHTYTVTFATIGKAASYGSDLSVTPRAQLDQPEFEICLVESRSRLRYLRLLGYALRDTPTANRRGMRYLRATSATATGTNAVQVDGEPIGNLPMSFEIASETIAVTVP